MLSYLKVHNLALMDHLEIDFHEGFSALTGETGAGKSILIESIGFVLGERSNKEIIRTGENKAYVEAGFRVPDNSPAAEFLKQNDLYDTEEIIVYRDLSVTGRSSARINGTLVSVTEIKELGKCLIDLHGQHAHQSLLDESTHLSFVDIFAKHDGRLEEMQRYRSAVLLCKKQIADMEARLSKKERRLQEIDIELNEIDRADLREGEEEELFSARNKARYSSLIEEKVSAAYEMLHGESGALASTSSASSNVAALSSVGSEYSKYAEQIDSAYYILEDVSESLRDTLSTLSFSEESLNEIESRLFLIDTLKRKYGSNISEILSFRDSLSVEKDELEKADDSLDEMRREEKAAFDNFTGTAREVSQKRRNTAKILESKVTEHLKLMGMPNAVFSVQFTDVRPEMLSERGCDDVEFMFSANKGAALKSLSKTASGGEISRVMLAIKAALAEADTVDTLVFDEIDTGISGMIAHTVAQEMHALSSLHQILCVSHLPQIAAAADHQYYIYKQETENTTVSRAILLSEDERPKELARIMGSDQTPAGIEHAKELLRNARMRN